MSKFDDFISELEQNLVSYAKSSFSDYAEAAIADGRGFIRQTESDLKRWTKELASGKLSKSDFEWLLGAKKDLAELTALKEAGLARAELDRFFDGLIRNIVGTATAVFL